MTGKSVLHYIIEEKLGSGGAGEVYRARDTKLDRVVALRFLPPFLFETPEEEAKIVADIRAGVALNNSAVCKIYGVIESGEGLIVEMEYVEGTTLRERMKQAGAKYGESLPLKMVSSYALQIAGALNEAQQKSIVHHDLKPENILVTAKDQIKVMDFGLAKLKAAAALRQPSMKVEDVAYLAPELIIGAAADARTDVFAFGVMFFEMLTTRRPFHGDHETAMRYAIEHDEHDELAKFRPEISVYAVFIVDNALAKNPIERYQSTRELITHLEYWRDELSGVRPSGDSFARTPPPPKAVSSPLAEEPRKKEEQKEMPAWMVFGSYAVTGVIFVSIILGAIMWYNARNEAAEAGPPLRLSFVIADVANATDDPDLSVLAGMFTTTLEQSPHLNVLSRARLHDILAKMGRDTVTIIDERQGSEICGHAKIHALLVASIGKSEDIYTILVKVIDPAKNEYLFTDKEDGSGKASIPSMIDKLSRRIRAGLKESEDDIAAASPNSANLITTSLAAYRHYYYGERLFDRKQIADAQGEFKQAIALDPSFGLSYARLIAATSGDESFSDPSERDDASQALAYVTHIPERQRYIFDATMAMQNDGYLPALDTLHEMEKTYPEDKEMIYNIGDWSFSAGDFGSADKYLSMLLQIEPENSRAIKLLTFTYRATSRFKEMLAEAQKYVAAVHSEESYLLLGAAYGENLKFDEGIHEMAKARDAAPPGYAYTGAIAELNMLAGRYDSAEAEMLSLASETNPLPAKKIAYERLSWLYPYMGKYRQAVKAFDDRIHTNLELGDTASTIVAGIEKAMCMALMGGDNAGARTELYKALWYPPQHRSLSFMEDVALADALIGDFTAGDNVVNNALDPAQLPDWWMPMYRLVSNSVNGTCDDARAEGDSVFATGSGRAKMWTSYFEGTCLLADGELDGAVKALAQSGSVYENTSGLRGIFYAKSLYLLAKAYQANGDAASARESYRKFLDLWQHADNDLPIYKDALAEFASLGGK